MRTKVHTIVAGCAGSNVIIEIERTTGAKVNVKEFSGQDHDICVIRGRSEATQIAETILTTLFSSRSMLRIVWMYRCGLSAGLSVAQDKYRREIDLPKRSLGYVQWSWKSSSAMPSVATSDRHVEYKRPAPKNGSSNATDSLGRATQSRPGSVQQRQDEEGSTAQHCEETKLFRFGGVFLMIEKCYLYYGYFRGFVSTRHYLRGYQPWLGRATESRPGTVQQRQDEERTTTQHREETELFRFGGAFLMIEKFYHYYGYFRGFVSTSLYLREYQAWFIHAKVEPVEEPTRTTPELPKREILTVSKQPRPTRADKGEVSPPCLKTPTCVADHADNALTEYLAIVTATRQVNLMQCYKIWQAYKLKNEKLLQRLLDEAEGAIYDNNTHQVIRGEMTEKYMVAYSGTGGFVAHDEEKSTRSGKITFAAPGNDPIVVTAKCTKIMLEDKILEMAQTIQARSLDSRSKIYGVPVQRRPQRVPKIKWINGVPGCGKTTWVVQHFDEDKDVVATTTIEAAKDLKEKLVRRCGDRVKNRVRTMASILANGFREQYYRLTVDEALMNHFGSIIMAARLAGVSEIVLIGDVNQLPFLDRENLFELLYTRPTLVASISEKLLCTHRNPMDVAFALSDVYPGIFSAKQLVHSLKVTKYTGALIPRTSADTLYLVHTQKEKSLLKDQGYGSGKGSRMLTIHEAQGLTCEKVVIINTKSKRLELHDSIPHAIVAVSRHTASCVYYTDHADDAIALFAKRAMDAPSVTIVDYNRKMALQYRDATVAANMSKSSTDYEDQKYSLFSYIGDKVFNTLNGIKVFYLSMWYIEK